VLFVYNTMTLALAVNLFFGFVDPSGPESAVDEFVCAGRILPMEAAQVTRILIESGSRGASTIS
jgi:hypothetical protein